MALNPAEEMLCSSWLDMVSTDRQLFGDGEAENSASHAPVSFSSSLASFFATVLFPMTEFLRHHLALGPAALIKCLEKLLET